MHIGRMIKYGDLDEPLLFCIHAQWLPLHSIDGYLHIFDPTTQIT